MNITRAMTSAGDCWTDHRLIPSTTSISLMQKRSVQKTLGRPRLNIERLDDTSELQHLQTVLGAELPKEYPDYIKVYHPTRIPLARR